MGDMQNVEHSRARGAQAGDFAIVKNPPERQMDIGNLCRYRGHRICSWRRPWESGPMRATELRLTGFCICCFSEIFHRRADNDYSRKGLPEISSHVANEAMHRHLCNAVADDRVHGPSHGAERWFIKPGEI